MLRQKKRKEDKITGKQQILIKFFKTARILPSLLLFSIMILSGLTISYYDVLCLSPYQTVFHGESLAIPQANQLTSLLPQVSSKQKLPSSAENIAQVAAQGGSHLVEPAQTNAAPSDYELRLTAGIVPLKSLKVEEIEPRQVVAGGHSIGILLQTEGVTVVGHSAVINEQGAAIYPAKENGLKVGDFVTDINGKGIHTNAQIRDLIDELGQKGETCTVRFIRDNVRQETKIQPLYCTDSHSFRIGLYVRDNTAGVGTLTFYDPQSGAYGALGHMVSDLQHGVEGEEKGMIVRAAIQGVKSGAKGNPGEKLGVFIGSDWQGSIETNGEFGIFGRLEQEVSNDYLPQTLPVALPEQVQTGPARIFTVIEGEKIQTFDIEIIKTMPNYKSSGKGMIIKITDERLLEATGGIVQGMSGSPIVQNGKLVGAVTHVFINDPSRGYACFAQWMLEEAHLNDN